MRTLPTNPASKLAQRSWVWAVCLLVATACAPLFVPAAPGPPEPMVVVPAGWFLMGQDDGPRASRPQRQVYLDTYVIDRTEVTQAQFALYLLETGSQARVQRASAKGPMVGVLWKEADAYCRWVGRRLPSEAEWEKAARGTDGRRYPWGDPWDPMLANTSEAGPGQLQPVGTYPAGASPYDVLDMAGNAAEWVADSFDPNYYSMAPDHNPPGPEIVMDHVLRGGSWASPREHAQTFFRDSSHSARPNPRVGFRCAQDWPPDNP